MKAVARRLRRLEQRLVPQPDVASQRASNFSQSRTLTDQPAQRK
jgi:hypothetical protein